MDTRERQVEFRILLLLAGLAMCVNLIFIVAAVGGIKIFPEKENVDVQNDSSLVLYLNSTSLLERNSIKDNSLRENDGEVFGTRVTEEGFQFDGIDDRILVGDHDDFSINTTGELTVSLWIKFGHTNFTGEGSQASYIHFMGKGGNGGDYEWMWRQYNSSNEEKRNNRISFYVFNAEGGLGSGSYVEDRIDTDKWIHLVGVVRGNKVEVWKNGVLRDSDLLSNYFIIPENGPAPLQIGTTDGDSHFKGNIDEVRIYNRALTKKEIRDLHRK